MSGVRRAHVVTVLAANHRIAGSMGATMAPNPPRGHNGGMAHALAQTEERPPPRRRVAWGFSWALLFVSTVGCMRSGPIESDRPLCGEGEQIVMAHTLFCVYLQPTDPVECAAEVPHRHQLEDTVVCSHDPDPSPILLAAVAEAAALPPPLDGLFGFVFGGTRDAATVDFNTPTPLDATPTQSVGASPD
jgi:hypothetical protein